MTAAFATDAVASAASPTAATTARFLPKIPNACPSFRGFTLKHPYMSRLGLWADTCDIDHSALDRVSLHFAESATPLTWFGPRYAPGRPPRQRAPWTRRIRDGDRRDQPGRDGERPC